MPKNQKLVIPALLWIAGLIIAKYFFVPINILIPLMIAFFLLTLFKRLRIILLLLLILLLGVLRFEIRTQFKQDHINTILETQPTIVQPITGRIISEVKKKDDSFQFIIELYKIKDSAVDGKVRIYTHTDSLRYGDIITSVATLKQISGSTNPGAFDYKEFLEAKRIFGTGWFNTPVKKLSSKINPIDQLVINIRKLLRNRIENRFGKYAGFVKAVVIAEKDDISKERTVMTKAGLSHLLAVSGLHVGVISLIFLSVLNVFIKKRNISRIIIMIFLLLYAAICLWAPSVTRAAVMIILFFTSKILQRRPNPNNIIFVSLLIITAVDPEQLFSVGLQMSYLAVLVLVNIIPNIKFIKTSKEDIEILSRSKKVINGIFILIFSSLILNIFLAPITAYNFHQFGFNGIAGNILGIPLIGIILPLSLIIIFLPALAIPLFQNSFKLIMLIFNKWISFSADLPLHFDFIFVSVIQLLLIYLILCSIIFLIKSSNKNKKWFIFALTLIIAILISFGSESNSKLKVTFFDCGLGDLALLEAPNDQTILIDTGPPEKVMRSFTHSALPYLQKRGIKTIDHVIITHAHNDHYGGVFDVFENVEVKNLIVTDEFQNRDIWKKIASNVVTEQCSITTISDTTHINFGFIKVKILHPDKNYSNSNTNNLSIVARVDYKDLSILFTGDLEHEGEEYLIEHYPDFLDCDVLKVGHHGSKTASSIGFVRSADPEFAIISTAKKNRFNFPHQPTLKKFEFLGDNLMITGIDGACQIISDGETAKITTYVTDKNIIDNDLK